MAKRKKAEKVSKQKKGALKEIDPYEGKNFWQKAWYFLWEDNSVLSWLANILVAFVLIKFIVYPGLGFALATTHPIVAVVSGSMEHDGSFDDWWNVHDELYAKYNISKDEFKTYSFKHGFNTGDIMVLKGKTVEDIEVGDVLVFWGGRSDPIIHRVVKKWETAGNVYFHTKGDHNLGSNPDEVRIEEGRLVGYAKYEKGSVAVARVPMLGYIKILAVKMMSIFI